MTEKKQYKFVVEKIEKYPVIIETKTLSEAKNGLLKHEKEILDKRPIETEINHIREKKYTTEQQKKAMHLYFNFISEALNELGITLPVFFDKVPETSFTPLLIKEQVGKPIQKKVLGVKSTQRIETKDIDKIYDPINKMLSEEFGLHIPFPSRELKEYMKGESYGTN